MSTPTPLAAEEFSQRLTRAIGCTSPADRAKLTIEILVSNPGTIGPTTAVPLERVDLGFDWDRGRVLIKPLKPLTLLSSEEVAAILKSVRMGSSYHAYQRYKKQEDEKQALVSEIARLTALSAKLSAQIAAR